MTSSVIPERLRKNLVITLFWFFNLVGRKLLIYEWT